MDSDAHQRAGDEARAKIDYWRQQISLAEQEHAKRVESYNSEIAKEEQNAKDHYQHAEQLRAQEAKDADDRKKEIVAGEAVRRLI